MASPTSTHRLAGGVPRAYSGDATLMVGASDSDFERARPDLTLVTDTVFHVGPVGAGHAAKLVNNLLNACNRFAALETISLAERFGIRQDLMVDVINVSSGKSWVTEYTFPALVATGKKQGFTLELMRKDVRLANELASHVGHDMPLAALVASFMDQAVHRIGATQGPDRPHAAVVFSRGLSLSCPSQPGPPARLETRASGSPRHERRRVCTGRHRGCSTRAWCRAEPVSRAGRTQGLAGLRDGVDLPGDGRDQVHRLGVARSPGIPPSGSSAPAAPESARALGAPGDKVLFLAWASQTLTRLQDVRHIACHV